MEARLRNLKLLPVCRNSDSTKLNRNKSRIYWRVLKIDRLDPFELNIREDSTTYKKLLSSVDLTKDFFFSYSYNVMCSLQKNLYNNEPGEVLYETMFVWNEFLTRGIRNHLKNTLWTVALVYGFFKQASFSVSGRSFKLMLIARRSRHYAGTRYLKRGVNEKGSVANDVETEQIVFEDVSDGFPTQITSIVQNRGSIPLFWSQETSRLNLKPDIIQKGKPYPFLFFPVSKKDQSYEATRLHFENLVERYGNPIIILNLIKTQEKKPRESILRQEFANAIDFINKDLSEENRLRFLHWDLHKHSRSKSTNVLLLLGKVANYALTLTGFFYCRVTSALRPEECMSWPSSENIDDGDMLPLKYSNDTEDIYRSERNYSGENNVANGNHSVKPPTFQRVGFFSKVWSKTILLTNFDRNMLSLFEKIFSQRRGQWRAATQSQEFFRTLQRYYSNAYIDAEKQNAINIFLGHFQPQPGKPALWELGSYQHYRGRNGETIMDEDGRSLFKRSFSDGNILWQSESPVMAKNGKQEKSLNSTLPGLSESSPEISTCESDITYSRYTPSMPRRQLFGDMQRDRCLETGQIFFSERGDGFNYSNFVDLDCISSSGNSCEDEPFDRSSVLTSSSIAGLSLENFVNGVIGEATPSSSECGSSMKGRQQTGTELSFGNSQQSNVLEEFSDSFVQWVNSGEMLCY
ncbi:hypothetical protein GOBAR_DD05980 [Gossypium barbadense]|nr:hypothetical protein GOBAR_DD05980 [Gossypium barbadense]